MRYRHAYNRHCLCHTCYAIRHLLGVALGHGRSVGQSVSRSVRRASEALSLWRRARRALDHLSRRLASTRTQVHASHPAKDWYSF